MAAKRTVRAFVETRQRAEWLRETFQALLQNGVGVEVLLVGDAILEKAAGLEFDPHISVNSGDDQVTVHYFVTEGVCELFLIPVGEWQCKVDAKLPAPLERYAQVRTYQHVQDVGPASHSILQEAHERLAGALASS